MADQLKQPPRVARDLSGGGALPDPENLIKQTPDQLVATLGRFGITPDMDAIDIRAQKAFTQLQEMAADGVMPDAASLEKLATQHEQEMAQALRQMVKTTIRLYRFNNLPDGPLAWVTSGLNVCPSCEPRHGQVKTYAQWQTLGLPGSGALICKKECNCELVPAGASAD